MYTVVWEHRGGRFYSVSGLSGKTHKKNDNGKETFISEGILCAKAPMCKRSCWNKKKEKFEREGGRMTTTANTCVGGR